MPLAYRRDLLYGGYQLTRSFGHRFTNDLSIGVEATRSVYGALDLSGYDPRAAAQFQRVQLPVSEQRVSPFVQLHAHRTDDNSLLDVETLSLSDLDEVERWLRGELKPAVRGQKNPGTAVTRGIRTLVVRLLGGEKRHYEARSGTFKP